MGGTRRFEANVQLDSGLIIPTGAADGYVLTSDGSGNATWGTGPTFPPGPPVLWSGYAAATARTPSTTRPTFVSGSIDTGTAGWLDIYIDGSLIQFVIFASSGVRVIVPYGFWVEANHSYQFNPVSGSPVPYTGPFEQVC